MPSVPNKNMNRPADIASQPPRIRAAFRALVFPFLLGMIAAGTAVPSLADQAAGQAEDHAVHVFDLGSGLSALVDREASLAIYPSGSRLPLLQTELVTGTDPRRRRSADTFNAVVGEGVAGGHRGFSSRADDDGDGRTDEDPLDGIDNDGDGRIDEDFAAISDAMVTVHLDSGGPARAGVQMEYYHWSQASLGAAVFLNAGGGTGASAPGPYRILTRGPDWRETGIRSLLHSGSGQPELDDLVAFVSRVDPEGRIPGEDSCRDGSGLWLGVMILDENSPTRIVLDGDRLELPLGDTAVPAVICAAESWLQLNRILGEARRLYEGMADPVDNRRARWIAPPACSACRASGVPEFDLDSAPSGPLVLSAAITAGQCGLLDPDLFVLDGRRLGAPLEIRWVPARGKASAITWNCATSDRLVAGTLTDADPFVKLAGSLDHKSRGRLEFVFERPEDFPVERVENVRTSQGEVGGRCLDGRSFRTRLRAPAPEADEAPAVAAAAPIPADESVEEVARGYAEDRARLLKTDRHHLSLSPDLLAGWPNPFNDVISIRFTVPRTMAEAFVWKNGAKQPAEIDLEGEVPWPGGQPGVTVKIYSISGQELVTLNSASLGPGDYTAQWNGTDAFGRKVASGTYFCKLQLDDWSVTRRLVFIR